MRLTAQSIRCSQPEGYQARRYSPGVSQHLIFTKRARLDCERCGVDEDDVRDLVDNPSPANAQERPDPGDPATVLRYVRAPYVNGTLEVTCEPRPDGRLLVRRVIVFCEDPGD